MGGGGGEGEGVRCGVEGCAGVVGEVGVVHDDWMGQREGKGRGVE